MTAEVEQASPAEAMTQHAAPLFDRSRIAELQKPQKSFTPQATPLYETEKSELAEL